MTSLLSKTFNMSSDEENLITENNLDENLKLNTEFLHKLREGSKHGGKKRLVAALNRKQRRAYGRLRDEEIQVIDIRQVHPTCKALINQDTGDVDFPNGLQIRKDETTDIETISKFEDLLNNGQWEVTRDQMIVILLPECYQYIDPITGIKVIYAVIDGNHRYQAIDRSGEKVLFAWIVEFDELIDIYEFGNAFCNRDSNVVNPRTHADVAHALTKIATHPTSSLHQQLEQTKTKGYNGSSIDKILEDYLRERYDYTRKNSIAAVINKFNATGDHKYHSDFKRYDADQLNIMIESCRPDWKDMPGVSSAAKILTNKQETVVILPWLHRGTEMYNVIKKMANAHKNYPGKTIVSCYAPLPHDAGRYTEKDIDNLDSSIKKQMFDTLKEITDFGNAYFYSDEGVNVRTTRLPVYSEEVNKNELIQY